ncbi:MAG: HAD-IA family hydrolase [Firmicutes bacterium]|nr:HAD-IA family hydrolase [Bacillota bacterium]
MTPAKMTMAQRAVDCVLLDMDGTILDSRDLIVACLVHTVKSHLGLEPEAGELAQLFGRPLLEQVGHFCSDPQEVCEMAETYRRFWLARFGSLARLFPGARRALETLRLLDLPLALVTSKNRALGKQDIDHFDLSSYFQVEVYLEDGGEPKPDPAPFRIALQRLGHGPEGALMVGDSPADILGGKAAGVRTAAVSWGYLPLETLRACGPDYLLAGWEDLIRICGGNGASREGG